MCSSDLGKTERVIGRGRAGQVNGLAVVIEDTGFEGGGRYDRIVRQGGAEAVPLGVDEEERLVLDDRSAQ